MRFAAYSGQRYAHTCSGGYMLHPFSADGTSLSLVDENSNDNIVILATILLADSTGAME
jgi:hypothetical protein